MEQDAREREDADGPVRSPPAGATGAPAQHAREDAAGEAVVEPLILAFEAYPRMEEVALSARSTLLVAMRILEPATALRSEAARARGLKTWRDLLVHVAGTGVDVRVLVADFDPILAGELHEKALLAVEGLADAARDSQGRLAILPARHPGELGAVWRTAFWPFVRRRMGSDGKGVRRWPPVRLWPATHHMKIIVADASAMVIGGLDINERRYDEPSHDRPAEETWHDVSACVTGTAARDADRFVRWLWRQELARRDRLGIGAGDGEDTVAVPSLPDLPDIDPAPREPDENVRFMVTASEKAPSPFAVGPRLLSATMIEEAAAIVRSARRYLYIENQFVRDPAFLEVVVRRMRDVPSLALVVLVPAAPDKVAFENEGGAGQRHGEWLQVRALDRLMRLFGERVGVFMLAGARLPKDGGVDEDRAEAGRRGIVYVHSKVMIADDAVAAISSANLNARSLRMDIEAGIVFGGRERVTAFRHRLWRHHLGRDLPDEEDILSLWRGSARANARKGPGDEGPGRFVLDWDRDAAAAFARRLPFVPERYV